MQIDNKTVMMGTSSWLSSCTKYLVTGHLQHWLIQISDLSIIPLLSIIMQRSVILTLTEVMWVNSLRHPHRNITSHTVPFFRLTCCREDLTEKAGSHVDFLLWVWQYTVHSVCYCTQGKVIVPTEGLLCFKFTQQSVRIKLLSCPAIQCLLLALIQLLIVDFTLLPFTILLPLSNHLFICFYVSQIKIINSEVLVPLLVFF